MSKAYKYPTAQHEKADRLLAEFILIKEHTLRLEAEAEAQLSDLRKFWTQRIQPNRDSLAVLEEQIQKLEKEHQAVFFGETTSCRATLPNGVLLYDKSDYVVKPRKVNVLEKLERYGFEEAIKRTAAVNWDVLEDKEEWPDEALAIIGTRRESKEIFGYELNEPKPKASGPENS